MKPVSKIAPNTSAFSPSFLQSTTIKRKEVKKIEEKEEYVENELTMIIDQFRSCAVEDDFHQKEMADSAPRYGLTVSGLAHHFEQETELDSSTDHVSVLDVFEVGPNTVAAVPNSALSCGLSQSMPKGLVQTLSVSRVSGVDFVITSPIPCGHADAPKTAKRKRLFDAAELGAPCDFNAKKVGCLSF